MNFSLSSSPANIAKDHSSNEDTNDHVLGEVPIKQEINLIFPDEYIIPQLPQALLQGIEAGALHKFRPHHTNRQVLIDTIAYDLINRYSLL